MRRLTIMLALLAAAALLPAPATAQNAAEQMRVLYPRAELMLRTGDVEGAVATLDRLIELGEGVAATEADRLLLRRAYELRVALRWEQGARNGIDADLDRIVELDPAYEPGQGMPAELRKRFRSRRQRKVGFLRIGRFPADAGISVDGRELEEVPDLLPLLAGDYVVVGSRPGYASVREEVRVRADRTEGVGIELARSSATLRLATRPPGAELSVDGDRFGQTVAAADGAAGAAEALPSEPLVVDGLLPGFHDIEVTLPGYQPFRQRIEIPDLTDYDLGTLELRRSVGTLLLRGLPADARIVVDGQVTGPDLDALGAEAIDTARLGLPIGPHDLVIDAGRAGIFATTFAIEEGGTTSIDVRVRPGIAWLGAFGGDALDRDAARSAILPALEPLQEWALLDRQADGDAAMQRAGGSAEAFARGDREAWASFRGEAREASGAGVFLAAVLPEERPAAWADLWVWGAEEAIEPVRLRVDLGTREGIEPLIESLSHPLPAARPWLGAVLIDDPSGGAVVIEVTSGSPAAQGGLRFGDRVVGFEGQPVLSAGGLWRHIASVEPFAGVVLDVEGGAGARSVLVTMGSSPYVPMPHEQGPIPVVAWAAAASGAARADSVYPAWSLQLLQAVLLIDAGDSERALDLLAAIAAPGDAPFGQAAVEYRRAVAKLSLARPDVEGAMAALTVAESLGGRLSHNDGPLVAPLARARRLALDGFSGER